MGSALYLDMKQNGKQDKTKEKKKRKYPIFNRPGVDRAVLQTTLSLTE